MAKAYRIVKISKTGSRVHGMFLSPEKAVNAWNLLHGQDGELPAGAGGDYALLDPVDAVVCKATLSERKAATK